MKQNHLNSYVQKYTQLKLLGTGSYGTCFLVKHKFQEKKYVAKKINFTSVTKIEEFPNQIKILKRLQNPFIVKYKENFQTKDSIIIIMEFCQSGDLRQLIKKYRRQKKYFSQNVISHWFLQICLGLQSLHQNKILHRDLKPQNILLTADKNIKIGDFGISKILKSNQFTKTIIGTYCFMSPEMCKQDRYSYQSDIWALGCILFELCNLVNPFQGQSFNELIYNIINNKIKDFLPYYSQNLKQVVWNILKRDKAQRWGINEIMKSNYILKTLQQQYLKKISQQKDIDLSEQFFTVNSQQQIIQQQNQNKQNELITETALYPTILSISNFVQTIKKTVKQKQTQFYDKMCFSATFEQVDMPGYHSIFFR